MLDYVALSLALGIVAYILIGYPLLLAAWPGKANRAIAKNPNYTSTVSIVLAVYNGAEFVRDKLESILDLDYPRELLQIIVVSDGSSDGTEAIVREFEQRGVQLLTLPHGGKAAALNAAIVTATGAILFFTDVRQKLDRGALRHLVANFADPSIGAVSGRMQLLKGRRGEQADMDLYWRYEVWVRQRHSSIDSIFSTTGCIYAMRRDLAGPIPPDTLSDDAVLPLKAFFRGYRVVFEPDAIAVDYPAQTGTEFRRRCRTLAGLWQVFTRMPQLFTSRDRMRIHFLSHKFGRLALPWAILLVFAATIALPATRFRSWMIGDECVLVLLALLDRFVPHWLPVKRITSPARTFLTMNAASIAAMAVFFTSPDRFWATTTRVERADT
jgi:cellulose synthase/poly-beta-1,6-N-acetylglucosamine synthase-like glycosyltransferase